MSAERQLEPVHLAHRRQSVARVSVQVALMATLAGSLGALAAALVRLSFRGLEWLLAGSTADPPTAAAQLALWRRAATPVLGALGASAVLWLQRRRAAALAAKPGNAAGGQAPADHVEYVAAVRHNRGRIPLGVNVWRTVSAAFSVGSGAAVGREGSMIQFAAATASALGQRLPFVGDADGLRFFVACGVAGGFTAAYNAPVAAAFAAAEIVLGSLGGRELPLLALASGGGWVVTAAVLGTARLYPAPVALHVDRSLLLLPCLMLLAGLAGPVYQWILGALRRARRLPLALVWSGCVVGCLSVLDPRVWGNGDAGLRYALGIERAPGTASGAAALLQVLLLRSTATLSCVWTGTVGGVFTPTLFTGGALGALCAHALPGLDSRLWAVAGMSCLMAAVTHAPVMAACMAVELTGNWQLLPVLLGMNTVSWLIARRLSHRALYAIASQAPSSAALHRDATPGA